MEITSSYGGSQGLSSLWGVSGNGDDRDAALSAKIFEDKDTDGSGGLSAQELGISADQLQAYDTDGDGVLSEAELQAALKAKREQMQARMQAGMEQQALLGGVQAQMSETDKQAMDADLSAKILADKDANGDGSLSADEMGLTEDQFKTLDTDGDGLVNQDELTSALTAKRQAFEAQMQSEQAQMAPPPPPSSGDMASQILADSDSNGDGSVSASELSSNSSLTDEIDTNQDGVISAEELQAWLEKNGGLGASGQDGSSDQASAGAQALGQTVSQTQRQHANRAYQSQSDAALAMLFGGGSNQNAVQGQDPFQNLSQFLFGDGSSQGLSAVA